MRALILAAAAALALSGCATLTERTGLTPEQQACAITEGTAYASAISGWADLSYVQRAAVVATGVEYVAAACEIESAMLEQARPVISAAIQAAALAE